MISCRNCGQLNDDAVHICRFCGTGLSPQPQATQQREYTPPPYGWADTSALPSTQAYTSPPASASAAAGGYRCPRCNAGYLPIVEKKISSEGMLIFILLLFFCFPLCWIGLLMKQESRVCPVCHANLG